ncbi:MAG TPA: right-handed parallel beta-helix repeat-containing protein [Casimicrobiaceae bacterium]|nr:right-handed parallel beta-helix repeat-containing protein [Casimicrobiaceae bacterium]
MSALRRLPWLVAIAVLVVAAGAAFSWAVNRIGVSPRRLAPYVERRAAGHDRAIVEAGRLISQILVALDRGRDEVHRPLPVPAGDHVAAQPQPSGAFGARRSIGVATPEEAVQAITRAEPGDVITLAPGTYRFHGPYIDVRQPGAPGAPIAVRAGHAGTVVLEFDMVEGFLVSAPYWTFENLTIRGVCANDSDCEHAFHVVAGASHFIARNNAIEDFNAQFKINASAGSVPDSGVIAGNALTDTRPRQTANPVAMIDLVAASHWRIVGNRLSDFVKAQGDGISSGAFAKGGGADNRFERNVVVCEDRLRGLPGQRVGLSLGDGGTGHAYCRDKRCITEQDRGVIASNLIAFCSDDGIYLNRAAQSRIVDNTVLDTGGVVLRFGESSATVTGNLVDGPILARDGAALHASGNRDTGLTRIYLGWHPVRRLFEDALALDLRWRGEAPRQHRAAGTSRDLCGAMRPAPPAYGAFEDIRRCPAGPGG